MLWYKAWLETRWRFLSGFVLLILLAAGNVVEYPTVVKLRPVAATLETGDSVVGRTIRDALEVQRDYRGYVWWQWVKQNLTQTWTLFAVLLGSAGLSAQGSRRATLFTLSLPASRNRLLSVHAGTALAELMVLAIVPSLVFPLMSPAIGETYSVGSALVHATCVFVAGTVFFSLTLLLSTVFSDIWRPMILACAIAVTWAVSEQVFGGLLPYGIFRVMSAEAFFRTGTVPWAGLLTSAAVSLGLLYGAATNFARMDI
jgi:ABC-2 type transport system permease protein